MPLFRNSHIASWEKARGARILLYHGICRKQHTRFNSLFLKKKTFEEHLRIYHDHFNVISLEDFFLARFRSDRFNICLTFDDGFANNYTHALPLLEKYNLPAAFFITGIRQAGYDILWNDLLAIFQKWGPSVWSFRQTWYRKGRGRQYYDIQDHRPLRDLLQAGDFSAKAEFIEALASHWPRLARHSAADYWLQMNETQIRTLAQSPLVTIGCHGYYHNDLSRLPANMITHELDLNRRFLQQLCNHPVKALSFPYGNYNRQTLTCSRTLGFTHLLATDFRLPGDTYDPSLRERMTVNPYISVHRQMKAIIHGHY